MNKVSSHVVDKNYPGIENSEITAEVISEEFRTDFSKAVEAEKLLEKGPLFYDEARDVMGSLCGLIECNKIRTIESKDYVGSDYYQKVKAHYLDTGGESNTTILHCCVTGNFYLTTVGEFIHHTGERKQSEMGHFLPKKTPTYPYKEVEEENVDEIVDYEVEHGITEEESFVDDMGSDKDLDHHHYTRS